MASPPEVLARPGGCPHQNLTLARLPAGWASIERRYGVVRSDRRQQQFVTVAIEWTSASIQTRSTWPHRPSPSPIHPRHKPNPTNPLPIRTNHNNSCFTRLALVVCRASLKSTTVVSAAAGAGSRELTSGRTMGECIGSGSRYHGGMVNRPNDVPPGSVVVTNPDEDCSPEAFHALFDDLLAGPEPELESLDAAEAIRELRADAEA